MISLRNNMKKHLEKHWVRNTIFFILATGLIFASFIFITIATIRIPDLKSFEERKIVKSTKIYDRTGEFVLFDIHESLKRTVIPFSNMGTNIKNAVVAVEDAEFYSHKGVRIDRTLKAILNNLTTGGPTQGGSTITQQLIKNSVLTTDKKISRKIKEWMLAYKIEKEMTKDQILETYLNELPYGNIYGIQEASKSFFGKQPIDLTLAESAYLAAIPQAPTYYSPYGSHLEELENRKNFVLKRMNELGFITEEEYLNALAEKVIWKEQDTIKIKAPHFVFYIKEYLENKYGRDMVENGGLKVISTLDWDLQQKAEEIVKRNALENEVDFNASNAALVTIDPKTGQVLTMVGSRDYFDEKIDGKYNVAVAKRQPGSSFKPFVYATAFKKGFTPNSKIFDVFTEFNTGCSPYGEPLRGNADCYNPDNFDGTFKGPITMRSALAESINVVAVKTLYLAGLNNAIATARDMGIKTLTDPDRYGLTLVLGGGEVTPLEMTGAYATFANEGIYNAPTTILSVEDYEGNVLEEFIANPKEALDRNVALMISDVLSDNVARSPTFGLYSSLHFPGKSVAAKTGTTNNNRDAWLVGYSPNIAVGVWSGNNDNTPMKKSSSAISGPLFKEFMNEALKTVPNDTFEKPFINDANLPGPLKGEWQGGEAYTIDTISGKLATEYTPNETKKDLVVTNVHSILYWIDKENPTVLKTNDFGSDNQFKNWETTVQDWWSQNKYKYNIVTQNQIPTSYDDVHIPSRFPEVNITSPSVNTVLPISNNITVNFSYNGFYPYKKADIYLNNSYLGSIDAPQNSFTFNPKDTGKIGDVNELSVVATDTVYNKGTKIINVEFSE